MKYKYYYKFFLLACLFVCSFAGYSQKSFHFTMTLPNKVDTSKLEFYFDNGFNIHRINYKIDGKGRLLFSGNYDAIYGVLQVQYRESNITYGKSFFIKDKSASIVFHSAVNSKDPFISYTMQNVWDFNAEKLQMSYSDSAERRIAKDYEELYLDKILSGKYPDLQKYYFNDLLKNIRRKKLGYILSHPDSYFSFYTFRSEIAKYSLLESDSLLYILNKYFPDRFKNSDEGNLLKDYILSRSTKSNLNEAIDFTSIDTKNNVVSLSQFKGKNFVLMHFWATWCSPCVKELPLIAQIDSQYRKLGLRIISIAGKSNKPEDFPKAIKFHKMNWIHIYNDEKLVAKYGNTAYPRLILIDKTGLIRYDTYKMKDDSELSQLIQILKDNVRFTNDVKGQTKNIDTIPKDSYDNFKNQSSYSASFLIIKSKENGRLLYEENVVNGKCQKCYDNLTLKADSCYEKYNYSDAAVLYNTAFRLNGNKGKVKHRLNTACCLIKLNDFDSAFEHLNKVVFGAKFRNLTEINSNDCFKPLQKDERWKKIIDGINKNLEDVDQKIKYESPIDQ